ncbi:MAG: hypothetical protein QXZ17_01435 [Nitrososphaerota archaeon]
MRAKISGEIASLRFRELDVRVPDFSNTNIEYWFKPMIMKKLTILRENIRRIKGL